VPSGHGFSVGAEHHLPVTESAWPCSNGKSSLEHTERQRPLK
jgi:hypothetical protein